MVGPVGGAQWANINFSNVIFMFPVLSPRITTTAATTAAATATMGAGDFGPW